MTSHIAICFFGFLGTIPSTEDITTNISRLIPENTLCDIYYYCPNKIHEFSDNFSIEEKIEIEHVFKSSAIVRNLKIVFYDYDPSVFMSEIFRANIRIYSSDTNYISIRWLSMFFSMSGSARLLSESPDVYKCSVVTRVDILPRVINSGYLKSTNIIHNDAYVLRTSPYRVTEDNLHAEDRFFYGETGIICRLKDIYRYAITSWNDKTSYGEMILYTFLKQFEDISIKYQEEVEITSFVNSYKYSEEFIKYYTDMYDKFKSSLAL